MILNQGHTHYAIFKHVLLFLVLSAFPFLVIFEDIGP